MNPFAPPGQLPAAPSRRGLVGCVVVSVVVFVSALVGLIIWGLHLVEKEVTAELRDNPVIQQRLGAPVACEADWLRSAADERMEYFHYSCEGQSARGRAVVHSEASGPNGEERIVDGTLELSDGARVPLIGSP
jgi:hypothetical protein